MKKNKLKNDADTVENVSVQNIEGLSKEQLLENIDTLTAKRDEIHSKLLLARIQNQNSFYYNYLMTMYVSLCSIIVDYQATFATLIIFAGGTIIECLCGEAKEFRYINQERATHQEMTRIRSRL